MEKNGNIITANGNGEVCNLNLWRLQYEMRKKRISCRKLAGMIGCDSFRLRKKLSGKVEFTLLEIRLISDALELDKRMIMSIFFS